MKLPVTPELIIALANHLLTLILIQKCGLQAVMSRLSLTSSSQGVVLPALPTPVLFYFILFYFILTLI